MFMKKLYFVRFISKVEIVFFKSTDSCSVLKENNVFKKLQMTLRTCG